MSPARRSWVDSANGHADFPIQNLPLGVFVPPGGTARGGVAIGDEIFDLGSALELGLFNGPALKAAAEAKRQEAAAAAAAARRKAAAVTRASKPGKKRAALPEIPPGTRRVLTADELKALTEVHAQPRKTRRASASADQMSPVPVPPR